MDEKSLERRDGSSKTNFMTNVNFSVLLHTMYRQFLHRDCNGTFCVKVFTLCFCFCDGSFIIASEIIHSFCRSIFVSSLENSLKMWFLQEPI